VHYERLTGLLLIALPIWFNVWFAVLARRFDYPDVLRRPPGEILERVRAGGSSLVYCWWAFMLSGLLFVAAAALLSEQLEEDDMSAAAIALAVAILATIVQMLGLLRWVYVVPALARTYLDPESDEATRSAALVTFRALHSYLGVGVGEHLGYLLTGAWTFLIGVAALGDDAVPDWLAWPALPLGVGLAACSLEFLGRDEEHGRPLAGKAVPVLYVVWSLWLLALGIAFLV
jgi:hypothetical protein